MQVAFHVGVLGTDNDKVGQCLAANEAVLRAARVELSPNTLNEPILSEALNALKGGVASPQMEEVIHDALVEQDDTRRLVVSRPTLLGPPRRPLEGDGLLMRAPGQMRALADVVPSAEVEFFIALKNPATYAPDLLQRATRSTATLAEGLDPATLRWAPAIRRMLNKLEGLRLVVWCNEDTPLIFPEVVRRIAGLPPETLLVDDNPVAAALLTDEGRARLAQSLTGMEPGAIAARRGATAAVLAEYHDPAALTTRIEGVEGLAWDQAIIDALTEHYDADVAEIAALPGIEFIHP